MKKYYYLILVFIAIVATNCSKDFLKDSDPQSADEEIVWIQKRNPNLPPITTLEIGLDSKFSTRSAGNLIGNSDKVLGYSYRVQNTISGDFDNVGASVIDIEKVRAVDKDYIIPKQLSGNETKKYTSMTFNRYLHQSRVTKTVKTGFKLNIKLFSLGWSSKNTTTFSSYINNTSNVVYGELYLNRPSAAYSLQNSEGARKVFMQKCMSKTFIDNIYSSTISNILDSYGDFVLMGYYTGGQAQARYAGKSKTFIDSTSTEKDLSFDIDASYSWKSGSASGDLHFSKNNTNTNVHAYKIDSIEVYIKTLGGIQSGNENVAAQSLDVLNVDLSSWAKSLNDVSKHTLIGLQEQGLFPLDDFVLEENFKRRMRGIYSGLYAKSVTLHTPTIEIARMYVRATEADEPLYDVVAVLNTRHGDKIILSDGKAYSATDAELKENSDHTVFMKKAKEIAEKKKELYELGIFINSRRSINPLLFTPLSILFKGFDEENMFRYKNPDTEIEYIYDRKNRIAFSFLAKGGDDWLLDAYGIREWVEALPYKNISMGFLVNSFRIVGL